MPSLSLRPCLPRSLGRQFALALSALVLLIVATGLLAIHALRDAAETTQQLAGERLVRMEEAQELERQALLIGSEAERMWRAETLAAMHARHAEVTDRLSALDDLVNGLVAASDDVAILTLHEANQLFRNSVHVAAGLRESAFTSRTKPADAKRQRDFYDDLQRQAVALVAAAQDISQQYTADYRGAIDELARTSRRDQGRVLALLVGSLILAWFVSHYFLGRRIIARLREVSLYLRRGEVVEQPARVPVQGGDEIAEMARAVEQFLDDRARLAAANRALKAERERQEELIGKLAQAQSQLLQSEKLAAIGQLAAGVAHEINNPVGFVNSNLGTLRHYLEQLMETIDAYEASEGELRAETRSALAELKQRIDLAFLREDAAALVTESTEGLQRVTRIVQDLKDFSHVDESELQWANLEQGLDSTLNVAWNELKYKAEVVKEYGGIPEVECIASQINQVFMNLLINAAQAIAERGTITLRTAQQGDHVHIEIADTGCGINPDHLKRIFDPFFTTKPVGKGTGLGLSLAYGIIRKHGGGIDVSSELGVGTTFRITLPIHAADEVQTSEAQASEVQ
jgi:two-component system, NtrC family, sensor kinase